MNVECVSYASLQYGKDLNGSFPNIFNICHFDGHDFLLIECFYSFH